MRGVVGNCHPYRNPNAFGDGKGAGGAITITSDSKVDIGTGADAVRFRAFGGLNGGDGGLVRIDAGGSLTVDPTGIDVLATTGNAMRLSSRLVPCATRTSVKRAIMPGRSSPLAVTNS